MSLGAKSGLNDEPRQASGRPTGFEARRLGIVAALLSIAVDQASKGWLLHIYDLAARQPLRIASFLDLILAWNPGISFSLFPAESVLGRVVLNGLTFAAVILLCLWLWKTSTKLTGLALGLLIGGALGNVCDRIVYGAVVDFVSFHLGHFYWYVFNGADCAITIGVVLLLAEWIMPLAPAPAAKMP